MATTTIRVSTETQEKVRELSRTEGKSAAQLVGEIVKDYEKRRFFEQLAEDFRRLQADPIAWADYQRELAEWDSTLLDGLEDEPPWED